MQKDKRAIKTEQAFLDAYVRLAKTTPAHRITVATLCREADVNRGTFYRHFQDIPDFLTTTDKRIVEELLDSIRKNPSHTVGHLTTYMLDHAETVFTFLERPGGPGLSIFYQAFYGPFMAHPELLLKLPSDQQDLFYAYAIEGLFALFRAWWKSGFAASKEDVRKLFICLATQGYADVLLP